MADSTLVRLVDEQRAQARWLLQQAEQASEAGSRHTLVCAAARALHICLTAYFAELTQARFDRGLWPKLLACHGSFVAMARLANSPSQWLAEWLDMEARDDHVLSQALQLIAKANEPVATGYRSGLLSSTSLSDAASTNVIASSAGAPLQLNHATLIAVFVELEAAIERQRAHNLEC